MRARLGVYKNDRLSKNAHRWPHYLRGYIEGWLMIKAPHLEGRIHKMLISEWPLEEKDTPVWIGFDVEVPEGTDREIYITDKEEDAGVWLIRGRDVGFLPEGLANPSACKWLDLAGDMGQSTEDES